MRCLIFISYNQTLFIYFSSSLLFPSQSTSSPSCSLRPVRQGVIDGVFVTQSDAKFNHTWDCNVQPYRRISSFSLCLALSLLSSANSHTQSESPRQNGSSGFLLRSFLLNSFLCLCWSVLIMLLHHRGLKSNRLQCFIRS